MFVYFPAPGSAPAFRPPGMSNGPVSAGTNHVNSNHVVSNGPELRGRPGPPPPPPSTTKPKFDSSNNNVSGNGHILNGGISDYNAERKNAQDFAAGVSRGPPLPPNRQAPTVRPQRNFVANVNVQSTTLPNSRSTSSSMVGRPLPAPPMQVAPQPRPPISRPPSVGIPQPPATRPPPPPPNRPQPMNPVQNSLHIRTAPPAPPQRTTSTQPGGTIGRSARLPPPPPVRGSVPPPPPQRKSGHYSGGYDGKFTILIFLLDLNNEIYIPSSSRQFLPMILTPIGSYIVVTRLYSVAHTKSQLFHETLYMRKDSTVKLD